MGRLNLIFILITGYLNAGFVSVINAQETTREPFSGEAVSNESGADKIGTKFIGNLRLRYEGVDDDSRALNANALTLRYRGTLESHIARQTTFLAEIEATGKLVNEFDDGSGEQLDRPFVPDPAGVELNRLQILTEIIPKTRLTIGRQRIVLDDERFVGLLAFRQNDQTFDAIRASSQIMDTILVDTAYIRRTNRVLGNDNPNGVFRGDSFLVNVNAPSPLGRVTGFHYSLDLTTGPADAPNDHFSSQTSGLRIIGRKHWDTLGLVWEGSYARQSNIADNPNDYTAHYWLGSVSAIVNDITLNFRSEILSSDPTSSGGGMIRSFQTPIGTVHKFQGDADIFLVTPQDGIVDIAPSLEWRVGAVGFLRGVKAFARYHWFSAEEGGAVYGQELNFSVKASYKRNRFAVEFADYRADSFAADTQRIFLTIAHAF